MKDIGSTVNLDHEEVLVGHLQVLRQDGKPHLIRRSVPIRIIVEGSCLFRVDDRVSRVVALFPDPESSPKLNDIGCAISAP